MTVYIEPGDELLPGDLVDVVDLDDEPFTYIVDREEIPGVWLARCRDDDHAPAAVRLRWRRGRNPGRTLDVLNHGTGNVMSWNWGRAARRP